MPSPPIPSHSSFCYPAMQTVPYPHLLLLVLIVTLAGLVNTTKKMEVSMCNVQLVNTEVRQILCQLLRNKVESLLLPLHLRLRKLNVKKQKLDNKKRKLNAKQRNLTLRPKTVNMIG